VTARISLLRCSDVSCESIASHRDAGNVPAMSASHPITTELVRHKKPALRAINVLTRRSKKHHYSITSSARARG
jgi:hypothetical protein